MKNLGSVELSNTACSEQMGTGECQSIYFSLDCYVNGHGPDQPRWCRVQTVVVHVD